MNIMYIVREQWTHFTYNCADNGNTIAVAILIIISYLLDVIVLTFINGIVVCSQMLQHA